MLHPSTKKLIDRLAVMTAQKKIDWIEKDNGDVLYATEGYVVRLTPEPPRVLLSTEGGKPLEDASSNVLSATAREDGGTYGDLVTTLARDACRDARGTEDAISTLLAGLSETAAEAGDEPADAEATAQAADVYEEVTPDAVEDTSGDLVEDPVDETAALSAAAPDPAEADVTSSWSARDSERTDTAPAVGVTDNEDLVDASVPEAALVEEAATDDEATAFSSEADAADDHFDAGAEDAETDTVATLAGEDDADSESNVSGAVARLADEVNATPVDPIAADHTETDDRAEAPEEPVSGMGADDAAALEQADADEATTDTPFASEPEYEAVEDSSDEETSDNVSSGFAPTPSFSVQPDDAPEFGAEADETAPEAAAPVDEADDVPASEAETGTEFQDDMSEDVTAVAPVWDAAETASASPENEPVAATDEPETVPPIAEATASNVHYVPFGAGGIEAEGADVSQAEVEEQPEADEIESSIAAAATMMNAPDQAQETADTGTAPEPADQTTDAPDETLNTAASEPVSVPEAPAEQPYPGPPGPISLSGMGAGLGFGRTATGFQPSPPRPAAPTPSGESVTRGPVFIDATDDFTGETEAAAESAAVPDVARLNDGEDYVEASVSDADLDAVAPPEEQPQATSQPAGAETSLSLVESNDATDSTSEEDDAPRPARPKTRFNPWT